MDGSETMCIMTNISNVLKHMSLDPELGSVRGRALKAPGQQKQINDSHMEGRVGHGRSSGTIGATCSGSLFHSAETLEWLLLQTAEAKVRLSEKHCPRSVESSRRMALGPPSLASSGHSGLLQRCGCFVECFAVNLGKKKLQIMMSNGKNNYRSSENIVKWPVEIDFKFVCQICCCGGFFSSK